MSALTVQELAAAPDEVRRHLASVPEKHIETLQLNAQARELAEAYIDDGVITGKMRADAQHIAIATVDRVDVLVSWNFTSSICIGSTGTTRSTCAGAIPRSRSGHHGRCYQMSRTEKKFDAVAMMRSARKKISAEIEGMTLDEELAWLASQELKDPFLRRLRDRAAQQADAADRAASGS